MVTKVKAPSYTAQQKAYVDSYKAAPKLKPTVVIEDVAPIAKPTMAQSINDDIKRLFAKYKVVVPSTTRVLISMVAAFCVGMGIGYIGSIIVETLVISALMLTNSLFIGVIVYILGVMATMYVAYKTGGVVGNYIMSGSIDRSYQKCSTAVRSFFSFGNREVTS